MSKAVVRAFISYAHDDRAYGGQAQRVLADVGISAFLAHEDLQVSDEWRDHLLVELGRCQLFVPLLSASYLGSVWAQQEAGFIVSRLSDVVVAPLSLDGTRSGGFLAHVQSPRIGTDGITRELLAEPLASRFPRTILPALIKAATKAASFRHAEALIRPLVRFFPLFVPEEAQAFAEGVIENVQIWDAALCHSEYLPQFLQDQGPNLKSETLQVLQYQVEHRQWYTSEQ